MLVKKMIAPIAAKSNHFQSLAAGFLIAFVLAGCRVAESGYPVDVIDREVAISLDKRIDPLILVVEITADGKLSLNKIETGTIRDITVLSAALDVVFEDRRAAGISAREVVINPNGEVNGKHLERLIEALTKAKASPIRLIKSEF